MLSFLVAVRNAVIIVLLAWLGFEAGQSDDREADREGAARAMIGMMR